MKQGDLKQLTRMEFDCLLAGIELKRFVWYELHEAAGYNERSVRNIFSKFKRLGLFEKVAGKLQVTEKGKLIAAILIGKQRKRICERL